MAYKTKAGAEVFKEPSATSESLNAFTAGVILLFANDRTNDGWIKVNAPGVQDPCWVRSVSVSEVPDPEPQEIDQSAFVRTCIAAEKTLNSIGTTSPNFVLADFIIARALFETNLSNLAPAIPGLDGVGPLRVSEGEWKIFTEKAEGFNADYPPDGFRDPLMQVRGATYRMLCDVRDFTAAKKAKLGDAAKGETLPTYLDVFHAYLTNPVAAVAIGAATQNATDKAKPIGDFLEGLPDGKLSADAIKALFARDCFTGKRDAARECDRSKNVGEFAAFTEGWLKDCLSKAFDLIKTHAPEEVPVGAGGEAGWYTFAKTQIGIKEGVPASDLAIIKYFDATDFGPPKPTSSAVAWCGAFAAACMKASGNPVPKGAAAAENWKGWGSAVPLQSPVYPVGAVVVLAKSPGRDTTGHVGFFVERLANGEIKLLGGNQGDAVKESTFDAAKVVAVRWTDVPVSSASTMFKMTESGVPEKFWKYADLIIDRFARAGFTQKILLAAAIANAIRESGLDPSQAAGGGEQSFGLFQCNRTKGLGKNYSIEDLKNPEINISIIVNECKKFASFAASTTIDQAVAVFVKFIERPLDTNKEITERTKLAKKLLGD